jgi:hypothetical protein
MKLRKDRSKDNILKKKIVVISISRNNTKKEEIKIEKVAIEIMITIIIRMIVEIFRKNNTMTMKIIMIMNKIIMIRK